MSDKMKDRLNLETQEILKNSMTEVESLLKAEDGLLEKFAEQLLLKEELDYDDIEGVLKEHGKQNKRVLSDRVN